MSDPEPDSGPTTTPVTYSVHRAQDGAQVRAELTADDARSECAILNAQARIPTGQTIDGFPIYGSMFHGEFSRYEVRSRSGVIL